jgi:hypothetical protein
MTNDETQPVVFEKLDRLRTELAELAFTLDRRGRPEAADVAMQISGRVGEIRDEIAAGRGEPGIEV